MFISKSVSLAQALDNPNPITALVLVVVNAILEVFFLCLVGWVLARRGIVDDKAKKTLNRINVSLFTPALLFSKVAFSLSPDKLKDLAIIPVGFVFLTSFSAAVAWVLGTAFRLKPGQKNFAIACAMFQNSNSLPIALMQSLIGEHMPLEWGQHDSKDQMLGRALSYLVLFSTLGIIVRWSIGVRLLTSAENDQDDTSHCDDPLPVSDVEEQEAGLCCGRGDQTPLLGDPCQRNSSSGKLVIATGGGGEDTDGATLVNANGATQRKKLRKARSIFQSFPNTPVPSARTSMNGGSSEGDEGEGSEDDGEDEEEDDVWGVRHGVGRRDEDDEIFEGVWAVRWRRVKRRTAVVLRPVQKVARRVGSFMTVPLWAALLSLFVACVPPLQTVLNEAEPLKSAIKNAGNCSVPITLITLGAYFYRPSPPSSSATRSPSSEPFLTRLNPFVTKARRRNPAPSTNRPGETRTVFVAVVTRMVIVPMVVLPLFGWYAAITTNIADDPVFVVVACLLIGSPTAITLAQITSSAAGDTFEKLISRTLFVSYAVMTAPTTIALVLAALLIDRKHTALRSARKEAAAEAPKIFAHLRLDYPSLRSVALISQFWNDCVTPVLYGEISGTWDWRMKRLVRTHDAKRERLELVRTIDVEYRDLYQRDVRMDSTTRDEYRQADLARLRRTLGRANLRKGTELALANVEHIARSNSSSSTSVNVPTPAIPAPPESRWIVTRSKAGRRAFLTARRRVASSDGQPEGGVWVKNTLSPSLVDVMYPHGVP